MLTFFATNPFKYNMVKARVQNFSSHMLCCCYVFLIIFVFSRHTSGQMEKAVLPEEDFALSLWLITRTGWVYCERASVYMTATEQRFNEVKCKQCYFNLFEKHKMQPKHVTDLEIIKCSRNFGSSLIPSLPSFTASDTNRQQQQQQGPSSLQFQLDLLRQLNPLESIGVRAITCNSEVPKYPPSNVERLILPTLAYLVQLFSSREFSSKNDPKRQFPRKSYVDCLFGKLFETELALCPISADRRRCAIQNRIIDEETIFSTSIPINYG